MEPSQLACPHCGSALNFGKVIAAGTPVECLICMQTFIAQTTVNPAAPPATAQDTGKTKPAKAAPTPAKPAVKAAAKGRTSPGIIGKEKKPSPPPTSPSKTKPERNPNDDDSSNSRKQASGGGGGKGLVVLILVLLLLLGAAGAGVAVWKLAPWLSQGLKDDSLAANKDPKLVESSNDKAAGKKEVQAKGKEDHSGGDDDDLEKRRALEDQKKGLIRKTPVQANTGETEKGPPVEIVKVPQKHPHQAAIDKGVAYLKSKQLPNGSWADFHQVGHAGMGGLTLLECGVPATDPAVQLAAQFVRSQIGNLEDNYDLSAAILFLDRLGEPRDRPRIQGMSLRLLAAQVGGGWAYKSPKLDPQDMWQLYAFLHSHRKPGQQPKQKQPDAGGKPAVQEPFLPNDPFQQLGRLIQQYHKNLDAQAKGKVQPMNPALLKPYLQGLPVVQFQGRRKDQFKIEHLKWGDNPPDNSNTHFVILALWAARRHGVNLDVALLASYDRFFRTQLKVGGWNYRSEDPDAPLSSPGSMTCVGLLALAMGHAISPEIDNTDPKNPKVKPAVEDPSVKKGLKVVADFIPMITKPATPSVDHYFMWSVERVAMLYDLKIIHDKDWYGWGAPALVEYQEADGRWQGLGRDQHSGSEPVHTCFALLFLKQANLVQDLTETLRLRAAVSSPSP